MPPVLDTVLDKLREHEPELRRLGVIRVAVFGSVARGDSESDSDVDVLVELDPAAPIGVFEYSRVKLYIREVVGGKTDVVNRQTLKPLLRTNILRDAVYAF